jgi:hypothetical protein
MGEGRAGTAPRQTRLRRPRRIPNGCEARKIQLQNAQLEGELISRKAVTETGARIIADVRTALLSLGYRLAEKIAVKTDVREIARITEAEIRDVLGGLADERRFFDTLEAEALS